MMNPMMAALVLGVPAQERASDSQVAKLQAGPGDKTWDKYTGDPIPITPGDASSCGLVDKGSSVCDAAGWVFCINADCEPEPYYNPSVYGGKPIVKCHCWQPSNTDFSVVPRGKNGGANCVLGEDDFGPGGNGGADMCNAIKEGALISTYGPKGTMRDGTPIGEPGPYSLQAATCRPHTPWAWCWGAPC
jgi:hypothetical protein